MWAMGNEHANRKQSEKSSMRGRQRLRYKLNKYRTGGVGGIRISKVYMSVSSQIFPDGVLASTSRIVTHVSEIQISIVCWSVTDVDSVGANTRVGNMSRILTGAFSLNVISALLIVMSISPTLTRSYT